MDEPKPLQREVLEQRIKAACWLNGIGMRDLRERLGELKATKLLAEDMIKGEKPQDRRNRRDLAEALNVPETWFTTPRWWALIDGATEPREDAGEPRPSGPRPRDLIPPDEVDDEDEAETA